MATANCQTSYNQAEEARREASRAGRITVAGVGDRARPPRQCSSGDQQQDEDRRRPGADAPAAPRRPHRSVGGRACGRPASSAAAALPPRSSTDASAAAAAAIADTEAACVDLERERGGRGGFSEVCFPGARFSPSALVCPRLFLLASRI